MIADSAMKSSSSWSDDTSAKSIDNDTVAINEQ